MQMGSESACRRVEPTGRMCVRVRVDGFARSGVLWVTGDSETGVWCVGTQSWHVPRNSFRPKMSITSVNQWKQGVQHLAAVHTSGSGVLLTGGLPGHKQLCTGHGHIASQML